MTSVELCQGCLRDNEEEVAELWCNDCSEAVCRNCGKAHRRFVVAHDVISIKDVLPCRKSIPKNCLSHENKKLILFCIGHDKLICHECLSENHRTCNKILEIEKAAEGIKNSDIINDMKTRMTKLISILEKTQTENEQQLSNISSEKEIANDHIKEFLQCFKGHLSQIEINLNKKYDKIVKQNAENDGQLSKLKQSLQENKDWLCMLENSSSESNIFHALKYLDTIHVESENKICEIKRDLITIPLDVLPQNGMTDIEKLFQEVNEKSKLESLPSVITSTSEFKQSQMKVERESQPPPPIYQEQIADFNSTFGASCFTKDGRVVVEELSSSAPKYCLRVFDLQTRMSAKIIISENCYMKDLYRGSICMYDDTLVLLVPINDKKGIMVIDIKLQRVCRTIRPQRSEGLGNVNVIKWIWGNNGGKIYVLAQSSNSLWLCSIDFNGTILSEVNLPLTVADIDFDGGKRFFYTDSRLNDIHCILMDRDWAISKFYSCLDLKENCSVLHISGNELLLLEKTTKTVYKLDCRTRHRSILYPNDILKNATNFNLSSRSKKFAITMDDGKRIRIFPF